MAFNNLPSLVILGNLNVVFARFNMLLELVESLQYSVTLAYCMPAEVALITFSEWEGPIFVSGTIPSKEFRTG